MSIALLFLQMSSLQNDATVDKLSTKRFRQTATGLQTRVNPKKLDARLSCKAAKIARIVRGSSVDDREKPFV
jgi:hypothetical protein